MSLDLFHPLVRHWFSDRFGQPTQPQRLGWPEIAAGRHTLIAAPTGSGKTLAAFLVCIDRLLREGAAGAGRPGIQAPSVSPPQALRSVFRRNLEVPLEGIGRSAVEAGLSLPRPKAAVRSGDTPASQRAAMLKSPPHILVTTPESLYLLLTAEKSRALLRSVRTVIVD